MGTLRQVGKKWRAEVMVNGRRASKRFDLKSDARAWIAAAEHELRQPAAVLASRLTAGAMFDEFLAAHPQRVHLARETKRLAYFKPDPAFAKPVCEITQADVTGWRDRRLQIVTAGTVLRDWNLLSVVFSWAVEKQYIQENPFSKVRRPSEPPARDYLITQADIDRINQVVGWPLKPKNGMHLTVWAFHFAIETGMRRGEIVALTWADINGPTALVRGEDAGGSKSGKRTVPLSTAALALLDQVRHLNRPCPVAHATIDVLWRRIKAAAAVTCNFHDTRHLAITRLSKKLDVMALARMVGHRNISQLMTYYNPDPVDLASRLD